MVSIIKNILRIQKHLDRIQIEFKNMVFEKHLDRILRILKQCQKAHIKVIQ